ncbi:ABC transporter ATP-binding protein [Actinoplanes sp. NPDC049596]|uniref:ABC transporter ATP-binding protein n=1 Tax=unclassified Actinoplanes TaxID=2626549 RepID=UPI00342BF879
MPNTSIVRLGCLWKFINGRTSSELHFWRMVWSASPRYTMLSGLLGVGRGAAAWGLIIAVAHVVGAVTSRQSTVWEWLAIAAGCLIAEPLVTTWQETSTATIQAKFTEQQALLLADIALSPHGIGHLEDDHTVMRLDEISGHVRSQFGLNVMSAVWSGVGSASVGVAGFIAVGGWSWWAAVLALIAYRATATAWTAYLNVVVADVMEGGGPDRRRANYLRGLPLAASAGKEVRVFGLTQWLVGRYRSAWAQAQAGTLTRRQPAWRRSIIVASLSLVMLTCVLVALGRAAWTGSASVVTFVTVLQGIARMQGLGAQGDNNVQSKRARSYEWELRQLRHEHGLSARLGEATRPASADVDGQGSAGPLPISVADARFAYPRSAKPVFEHLNLDIPAAQSVAIVGLNGAGKSTLVKLLCGLYRVDKGSITIGEADPGVDDDIRRRVAVVFQDFVRYPLTLRDNVAIAPLAAARLPASAVDSLAAEALTEAAGDAVLHRLDGVWETILDPSLGGTDLSGGEWQRIAIARSLAAVQAGAGLLVLDEPTAALDVRSEAQIFRRILAVTRGVTTILVSHRLSSVRHVDRIVVLDSGVIVEDGTHEELLAIGGRYAELFALQASRFTHEPMGSDD